MNPTPFSWPLRRSCKQAAALLIAREDRALGLPDKLALTLHLMACKACPRFERQVLTVRAAMGHWRHYGSAPSDAGNAAPADTPPPPV